MERLLWLSIASDQPERPIRNFLLAAVPFVGPGKVNRTGESAFDHAVDMPTQHICLFVLTVPDRVHPKFAKNKRMLLGEILQAEQITLEIALVMQVNVKTKEIDVLRQQKFGRRIGRVRKQRPWIQVSTDVDEMLDEFGDATHTEPADHLRGDFVADEVSKDRGMTGVHFDGV